MSEDFWWCLEIEIIDSFELIDACKASDIENSLIEDLCSIFTFLLSWFFSIVVMISSSSWRIFFRVWERVFLGSRSESSEIWIVGFSMMSWMMGWSVIPSARLARLGVLGSRCIGRCLRWWTGQYYHEYVWWIIYLSSWGLDQVRDRWSRDIELWVFRGIMNWWWWENVRRSSERRGSLLDEWCNDE